jgi:tagatose 6-phosphate kinase
MILAAGLTPAWQCILRYRQLRLGEVNRAEETHWCASGKVLNAGMALASLGVASHTIAPVGGWSGAAIRDEFAARNIRATWTNTPTPTRVCTTILIDGGPATELVENAAPMTSADLAQFAEQYHRLASSALAVVLTGSLPKGTPTTFYRDLLAKTLSPVVLDGRGPELLEALSQKPRVVKPNREELAMTAGRPLPDRAAVLAAMRDLIAAGAQSVIVTDGKAAVYVMEGGKAWLLTPPEMKPVVNPIGCGDCLAAGVASALARGMKLIDAVHLGMAAAADNVTQLLPARLSAERVECTYARIAEVEALEDDY